MIYIIISLQIICVVVMVFLWKTISSSKKEMVAMLDNKNFDKINLHEQILVKSIKKYNLQNYAIATSISLINPFWVLLYLKIAKIVTLISVISIILSAIIAYYVLIPIGLLLLFFSFNVWADYNKDIMRTEKNPYFLKYPGKKIVVKEFREYYYKLLNNKKNI